MGGTVGPGLPPRPSGWWAGQAGHRWGACVVHPAVPPGPGVHTPLSCLPRAGRREPDTGAGSPWGASGGPGHTGPAPWAPECRAGAGQSGLHPVRLLCSGLPGTKAQGRHGSGRGGPTVSPAGQDGHALTVLVM